jgi:hypothetical protein
VIVVSEAGCVPFGVHGCHEISASVVFVSSIRDQPALVLAVFYLECCDVSVSMTSHADDATNAVYDCNELALRIFKADLVAIPVHDGDERQSIARWRRRAEEPLHAVTSYDEIAPLRADERRSVGQLRALADVQATGVGDPSSGFSDLDAATSKVDFPCQGMRPPMPETDIKRCSVGRVGAGDEKGKRTGQCEVEYCDRIHFAGGDVDRVAG